ncbi:MAG: hypothetical protein AAF764_10385 [Pseudomonadota bacterium]
MLKGTIMAHSKTVPLRQQNCAKGNDHAGNWLDKLARRFLGLGTSERLALTLLSVLVLFSLTGAAIALFSGVSMLVAATVLGVLIGAPGLALSLLNRSSARKNDC